MNQRVLKEVMSRGKVIIESDLFRRCNHVIHHKRTTAAMHMLHVACMSLAICNFLEHFNVYIDRNMMVTVCLLHDIGMVHRNLMNHPVTSHYKESVRLSTKMFHVSKREEIAIARHMFPVSPIPPTFGEGVVLTIADKICSIKEATGHTFVCNLV